MKKILSAFVLLFVAACLTPGDAIGRVDAMKPSSLEVDLAAGDTLRFRVDDEAELISVENQDRPSRQTMPLLQRSQLVVTVQDPKGSTTSRCPLTGNGMTEGRSGARLFQTGIVVACAHQVGQAGKHRVSASVEWDPALRPLTATVEVRRVKK